MKQSDSGEYISAHVSQADRVYARLQQSGVQVDGWRQQDETVYFRIPPPPPTHRRSRWWLWIVGAVVALFVVAGLLQAGVLAATVGASIAGVILFGVLGFIVWRSAGHRSVGFAGTVILSLLAVVLAIGAITSVEPLWNADAARRQADVINECGGLGNGDIGCRLGNLLSSGERLIEVANSPASDGLGFVLLGCLALVVGGGWLLWRRWTR